MDEHQSGPPQPPRRLSRFFNIFGNPNRSAKFDPNESSVVHLTKARVPEQLREQGLVLEQEIRAKKAKAAQPLGPDEPKQSAVDEVGRTIMPPSNLDPPVRSENPDQRRTKLRLVPTPEISEDEQRSSAK